MKRLLTVCCLALLATNCASVKMRYDTSVELKNKKEIYFTYERPVDISGTAVGCYFTFYFYGGWCWSYLFTPFAEGRKEFIAEAHERLESELKGRWFQIGDERLTRVGFLDKSFKSQLYNSKGDSLTLKPVKGPKHIQAARKIEQKIEAYKFKRMNTFDHPNYTMYLYGDAGSDFSYHGSGVGLGYKWTYFMLDFGLGLQNRANDLSNPISLAATIEAKPYFFGVGLSYYRGAGVQDVQFSDKKSYQTGIEWEYVLAHASAGTFLLQNALSNYQITLEIGAGSIIHADYNLREEIDPLPPDAKVEGILVGSTSTFSQRLTSQGTTAPFIKLALIYWLRDHD